MPASYDTLILDHYRQQAQQHGDAATSTMEDVRTRELESALILEFLDRALKGRDPAATTICDIGCGNGGTLAMIRERYGDVRLLGLEFTPELLAIARGRFAGDSRAEIRQGDIRAPMTAPLCDALICQRVLINLLDPKDQAAALRNLAAAVRPGGYVLSIEAYESGLKRLNEARDEFGLAPLPPAHHNLYLADDFFDACPGLKPLDDPQIPANFLSTHYFVTRVLHAAWLGPKPFKRNSHFVRFFSEALNAGAGDYAPLRAQAFQRP